MISFPVNSPRNLNQILPRCTKADILEVSSSLVLLHLLCYIMKHIWSIYGAYEACIVHKNWQHISLSRYHIWSIYGAYEACMVWYIITGSIYRCHNTIYMKLIWYCDRSIYYFILEFIVFLRCNLLCRCVSFLRKLILDRI